MGSTRSLDHSTISGYRSGLERLGHERYHPLDLIRSPHISTARAITDLLDLICDKYVEALGFIGDVSQYNVAVCPEHFATLIVVKFSSQEGADLD